MTPDLEYANTEIENCRRNYGNHIDLDLLKIIIQTAFLDGQLYSMKVMKNKLRS